jgi:hypothetical protein
VIYGLQERTKQGIKNNLTRLRPLCDMARARQAASLRDLDPAAVPKGYCGLHKSLVQHAVRQGLTPESERHKEIWELSAFGLRGTLRFTEITQPWLREATKRWAFDDLPRHRGNGIRGILQSRINSMAQLSVSLRLQREDDGGLPALLVHVNRAKKWRILATRYRDSLTRFDRTISAIAGLTMLNEQHSEPQLTFKILNKLRVSE